MADTGYSIIPLENVEAFKLLFNLENVLRELIIDSLSSLKGPRWYRRRLPGDILDKYKAALTIEKDIRWIHLVPHHPLYYLDFPDLRKIIEREDNWQDAFRALFGRKEILGATLSELEPIRNKVAHNRRVTMADVQALKTAQNALKASLGEERFVQLSCRCTSLPSLVEQLKTLQAEAEAAFQKCCHYDEIGTLPTWTSVRDEWWLDDSYLGTYISDVDRFFHLAEEYMQLPRRRGSGHLIEIWVKNSGLHSAYASAIDAFNKILAPVR